MTVKTRKFQIHDNLLMHLIERQAPSLEKGALELIMNSVDGGASRIDVMLTDRKLIVTDDGRGFGADEDEVNRVFGVFGEPHEDGDAFLGEFRMGRGQVFGRGKTTYVSGAFRLTVDLKSAASQWNLETLREFAPGCSVTVDLHDNAPEDCAGNLAALVRYLPVPVYLNGTQVSTPPNTSKWDLETDDAWIKVGGTALRIYNRGAFVRSYPAAAWGIGGDVVTKDRLKLTFGRNEVMTDCPVWSRITDQLEIAFLESLRTRKSKFLPEAVRHKALSLFCQGRVSYDIIRGFYLLRDARGGWMSLRSLCRFPAVSISEPGTAQAWRAIETGKAMVLSEEDIREGAVNLKTLLKVLRKETGAAPILLNWSDVIADLALGRDRLEDGKLDPHSRALLFGAQAASRAIARLIEATGILEGAVPVRMVVAGTHASEDIWSDGETTISISARLLDLLSKHEFNFTKAAGLLARAYLRNPMPTGDEAEPGSLEAGALEMISATALSTFFLTHLEIPISVPRSPLSGDPHQFSRYWNSYTQVRDLGDVARLWAEDYCRRCGGLGIMPKAGLAIGSSIKVGGDVAAADQTEEEYGQILIGRVTKALDKYSLKHWKARIDAKNVYLKRGTPKKPTVEGNWRDAHHYVGFMAREYDNPERPILTRWAKEPISRRSVEYPELKVKIAKKSGLLDMDKVLAEIVLTVVYAELSLGRLAPRSYAGDQLDIKQLKPFACEPKPLREGRGIQAIYDYRLPTVGVTIASDGVLNIEVKAHYLWEKNSWGRDDAKSTSFAITTSGWAPSKLGWERVAKLLRRRALSLAGEQALLFKLGKGKFSDGRYKWEMRADAGLAEIDPDMQAEDYNHFEDEEAA